MLTTLLKTAGTAATAATGQNGHAGPKQETAADKQLAGAKGSNPVPNADLLSTALLPRQAYQEWTMQVTEPFTMPGFFSNAVAVCVFDSVHATQTPCMNLQP
jgi:hypothetical protein